MPRIKKRFVFTPDHLAIVAEFELGQCAVKFWASDKVKPLKAKFKDHYKNEQNFTCCYCDQQFRVKHNGTWDAEHIVSKNAFPRFMFLAENLCISCKDCNGEKLEKNVLINPKISKYPKSGAGFLIVHPHFDDYEEHIGFENGHFFPRTKKGSFTIDCCGLWRFATNSLGVDRNLCNPTLLELGSRVQNLGFDCDESIDFEIVEKKGKRINITINPRNRANNQIRRSFTKLTESELQFFGLDSWQRNPRVS